MVRWTGGVRPETFPRARARRGPGAGAPARAPAAGAPARGRPGGGDDSAAVGIDEPIEGAVVGAEIRVAGRVPVLPDRTAGVLRVNGLDVPFEEGRFETVLRPEKDGRFAIRVVFSEIGAPASVVELTVTVDLSPPVIEVYEPAEEEGRYASAEATVRGAARDANLARVRMNERDVAFESDGSFAVVFLLPSSGSMDVEIEAIDRLGNRSAARRRLRYATDASPVEVPPPQPVPSDPRERAVFHALRWLAAHQAPDGRWACSGWDRWCERKPASEALDGAGKDRYDVGVTGLALLAFLRAGYGDRGAHPYARVVADGLRWLRGVQDDEGCVGTRSSGHYVYGHAIATLALVEALRVGGSEAHRAAAQRALDFVAAARNPASAWRYGVRPGDDDTSITGWMTSALDSARRLGEAEARAGKPAGLRIDGGALSGARAWIERATDAASGRVGYQTPGSGPARPAEVLARFPAERSEAMTAVGILVRLETGEAPDAPAVARGARLCAQHLPRWNTADGSIDMYYWFFGTEALARLGGPSWAAWRPALLEAVLPRQRADTDPCRFAGSFDPLDPWGADGGRVYATAIVTLALEAAAAPSAAAPGGAATATPDAKARLHALRDRATRWVVLRGQCTNPCDLCGGRGRLRSGACPRCTGSGRLFNSNLKKAYVEMRSPAWRARPEVDREFGDFYQRALKGQEPSVRLTAYRFGDLDLLDEMHAEVRLFENRAIGPTVSRWIWSSEQAFPRGTWYLYSEHVDGPWPR